MGGRERMGPVEVRIGRRISKSCPYYIRPRALLKHLATPPGNRVPSAAFDYRSRAQHSASSDWYRAGSILLAS